MVIDIQAVSDLIEEVAQTLVLPRFSKLSDNAVEAKATIGDPEDVVTTVDREVEAHLSKALAKLAPSAAIIGEEAAHDRPALLSVLTSDQPVWLIDPIDGTKNFAAGDHSFGIMVAYVVKGRARAAWIALPARRQTLVAEAGSGTFLNGERINAPSTMHDSILRGVVYGRFMPDKLGDTVNFALNRNAQMNQPSRCAAIEYVDILMGLRDFAVYYRLLPWDHAAPALVLTEAGGYVSHFDGQPYTARSENQLTIVARDIAVTEQLWASLRDHVPSNPSNLNPQRLLPS